MKRILKWAAALLLLHLIVFAIYHFTNFFERLVPGGIAEVTKPLPEVPIFAGDFFMVFSHADDELLTLAYAAKLRRTHPDKKIHWILVSDSGKGRTFPGTCRDQSVADCRSLEAREVAKCLGIEAPLELKLPDGELAGVRDLGAQIESALRAKSTGQIGAIMTSDQTGLYGHADHVVLHDTVSELARRNRWPLITGAIPPAFRKRIKLREPAENRSDPPITHVIDLDEGLKDVLSCAYKAHKSQYLVLFAMNQFKRVRVMMDLIHRQFFFVRVEK